MVLFHYHLVTARVREVEARYLGKLGFDLIARHGRIGEELTSFEAGHGWEDLDSMGFKLRLSELERGAVNVVVQPGQWDLPRVDHLGFALDELLEQEKELRLAELQLRADDPELKAAALGELLGVPYTKSTVDVGETLVTFIPDGPQGRPQLHGELFV